MLTMRGTIVASLLAVLLMPQPAAAGGWWTFVDTNRSTVAAGQRVDVRAQVMFSSIEAAETTSDQGEFYVYALRGLDRAMVTRAMGKPFKDNWWSVGDAEAVKLGRVSLQVTDGNLARARASFTVPDLAPASYALMLCDAGCAHALADVVPISNFTVVADAAIATLAQRADRLEERVARHARLLAAARRSARDAAADARSERESVDERLRALRLQVARVPHPQRPSPWAFAGWLVGGIALGALGSMLLRRRRAAKPPPSGSWQPSDDDLRELLSSRLPRRRRVRA